MMQIRKATEPDFVKNIQEIADYNRARKVVLIDKVDRLVNVIRIYFETLLLLRNTVSMGITVIVGSSWYELKFSGHDSDGNPVVLTFYEIGFQLVKDVCADLLKVRHLPTFLSAFHELVQLFTAVILNPDIGLDYKFHVIYTENKVLNAVFIRSLRLSPELDAIHHLEVRKDFVLNQLYNPQLRDMVVEIEPIPPEVKSLPDFVEPQYEMADKHSEVIFQLYRFYVLSVCWVYIGRNRISDLFQFLYSELEGAKETRIIADVIKEIVYYNNLFLIEPREIIREKIDGVTDSLDTDVLDYLYQYLEFSPETIELKDNRISTLDHQLTGTNIDNLQTVIVFVINQEIERDCAIKADETTVVTFNRLTNWLDDPIFLFLEELHLSIGGLPSSIFSDALPDWQDKTLVRIIFDEFYHPDFDLQDGKIVHSDYQEREALLGRTYYPHKEKAVRLLRKLVSEKVEELPFSIDINDVNINFISNYLVDYINPSNISLYRAVYTVTNLDSYRRVKNHFLERLTELNLQNRFPQIRDLLFSGSVTSSKLLSDFVYRLIEIVVKDQIEMGGINNYLWSRKHMNEPLPEREAQPLIQSHIRHIFNLKGIQISREVVAANGSLDYLCSYTKDDYLHQVCIELKNAHHAELLHGLTVQLPKYMDGEATREGIFVVLWYKGTDFDEPQSFDDISQLVKYLEENIPNGYRIRILVINCTKQKSPSKL